MRRASFCGPRLRSWAWPRSTPSAVLRLVAVEHGVALVVARLADQPAEDAAGIERVGDARVRVEPVEGEDVVLGDRAPMDVARRADLAPALDAGEEPFDARPVAADAVAVEFVLVNDQAAGWIAHPEPSGPADTRMAGDPGSVRSCRYTGTRSSAPERMKTSESSASRYCGRPLSVLRVIDGRERLQPKPNGPAGARVVRQRELRAEARAARAGGDRHRHRAGAGDRVGGELLADAADRAAALRERMVGAVSCQRFRASDFPASAPAGFSSPVFDRAATPSRALRHVRGCADPPCGACIAEGVSEAPPNFVVDLHCSSPPAASAP